MDSKKNHSIFKKLKNFLDDDLKKIKKPQILEFRVREGISTYYFLKEIKAKRLISVEINDCSNVIKHKNWTFLKSRNDNQKFINLYLKKNRYNSSRYYSYSKTCRKNYLHVFFKT
jgi:hypothetical protein